MRLLLLLLLCSCSSSYSDDIQDIVIKQDAPLRKKYNFALEAIGQVGPGVRGVVLDQYCKKETDINEARLLLVHYIEDLKYQLNENFTKTQVHDVIDENFLNIAINFYDSQGKEVKREGKISRACQYDGKVSYNTLTEDEKGYQAVLRETYQEALRIVSEKDSTCQAFN
jgi:uncharacterized protein YnzC (UPF0291/DUF896 family)